MGQFGIGQAVSRLEDHRLVTGHGRYTDDIQLPGTVHARFLRSDAAHAKVTNLDVAEAKATPGVLAVLTVDDLRANEVGDLPCKALLRQRDGSMMAPTPRPALADGVVRYVGDPIACVIAETPQAAEDAVEAILYDLEPLPAIVDLKAATEEGAVKVWDERSSNIAFDWEAGDGAAVDRLIAEAAHVIELELVNNRVIANSMEPRGAIAHDDPETGKLTLYTSCQGVHSLHATLARQVFNMDPDKLRVVCPDVGGGFGMKIFLYPEQVVALLAAKLTRRPVKWVADRSEGIVSDVHGRDHVTKATLALDADHNFLALRAEVFANLGAYLSQFGPFIPTGAGATMYNGVYAFEAVHFHPKGVFTHTTPVDAYRGAGRPEATYVVERLVDLAARRLGVDPAELRRKNYIRPEAMPFTTALGAEYDSGEFAAVMDTALGLAEVASFEERRAESARRGKLRGLGLAYYIEQCGGGTGTEWSELRLNPDGEVVLKVGTQTNGQGHQTAYAQLIAERLGIDPARVRLVQGDTDEQGQGGGTGGSRSMPTGGPAVQRAGEDLVEKAKALAADHLEVASEDLVFEAGAYTVKGTDKTVTLPALAQAHGTSLEGAAAFQGEAHTFPNGCHVAEVEIDPDTGALTLLAYKVCDDFGTLVNPALVAGQVHGGVVQGLGQALLEHAIYDASGQLLTGSFLDYAMPRADHVAPIEIVFKEVPCARNPLGVKGCGEAGAIAAPPTLVNAVVDALRDFGVEHVDMPITPNRLWHLLQGQSFKRAAE